MSEDDMSALRDLAGLVEHEFEVAALSESQMALASSNDELEMKARVDLLTRVWNRGAILDIAANELEQGRAVGKPTGVIMLDIDHFKMVNDAHGHPGGDEVLRVVGARLRASLRPNDAVGRYGGEEFMIVLPETGDEGCLAVGERIRREIAREPISLGGVAIHVTCSAGFASLGDMPGTLETVVRAADEALYCAKRAGRNRVVSASLDRAE